MTTQPTAFVIMPIKTFGSDEFQHFRSLYDEVLKPCLEASGYTVQRADDVQRTGAITKDIILRLAESDLVVADLTDLNPNVFYELGVRHALRGVGTVMLLDELRTADVPFDLGAYRVIKFKAELNSIGRLRADLTGFLKTMSAASVEHRDNPVHDWLPVLPINSLEAASGTSEGKLREQLADAKQIIRQYEKVAGSLPGNAKTVQHTPLETILEALQDAKDGNLGHDLLEAARATVDQRNRKGFLDILRRMFDRPSLGLRPQDYRVLAGMARHLGLEQDVAGAILSQGLSFHPKDQELKSSQLSLLAHSHDAEDRRQAREELARVVGVSILPQKVEPPSRITDDKLSLFGIMLDTYHSDGLHDEELRIAEAFARTFPTYTIVCRNMARALESCGRDQEAWGWYQRAIATPDASDSSAVWYGNTLHNVERHVDAMEVYLVACRLDPDDGANFSHVADELSFAWVDSVAGTSKGRALPAEFNTENSLRECIQAAFSCRSVDHECVLRCRAAAKRAEILIDDLEDLVLGHGSPAIDGADDTSKPRNSREGNGLHVGLAARVRITRSLYDQVKSPITMGPDPEAQANLNGPMRSNA